MTTKLTDLVRPDGQRPRYRVTRSGAEVFRGSHGQCFAWLLEHHEPDALSRWRMGPATRPAAHREAASTKAN